jgi:hypothetical protein
MPLHNKVGGTGGPCDLQAVGGQSADAPNIVTLVSCTGFDDIQKPKHSNTTTWFGQIIVK